MLYNGFPRRKKEILIISQDFFFLFLFIDQVGRADSEKLSSGWFSSWFVLDCGTLHCDQSYSFYPPQSRNVLNLGRK